MSISCNKCGMTLREVARLRERLSCLMPEARACAVHQARAQKIA